MLLQFCDKCGRPLSEGCLARGEAIERDGELVCSNCVAVEQARKPIPEPAKDTGPLGHYQQSVWSCETCGIPVTALDLIEGRGARVGGVINCSRCSSVAAERPQPKAAAAAKPRVVPGRPAPETAKARAPLPVGSPRQMPRAKAPLPRAAGAPAETYVAEAKTEQRRPIVPIIVFAIVLPMFAVSLFYAVTSQLKLNEVLGKQSNEPDEGADRRQRRPQEKLDPEAGNPRVNPPSNESTKPEPPPEPSRGPAKKNLPAEVIDDLVAIERDLAAPVIAKLQSTDLAVVWEGLIEAGSRRLIATRPYVRGMLADNDDNTRALACRVCGMLSDREALLKLTRMADQDPAEAVKIEARKARDRLTGEATRDIRDLTDAEIEEMLRDLKAELERRKGRRD